MKYIACLLFFISTLFANEHRLLISGFTKHEKSHRINGEHYNERNYGAGYEFTSFENYDELYFGSNFTALKDSFNEWQYTVSASPNIRFKLSENSAISVGLAAFVMYKKDNYKDGVTKENAEYDFMAGMAPLSSFYYKDFSVNAAYVPTFDYKDIHNVGFLIVYFGWRF